ncbi:MAG TPA: SDR family oxidoreductase [Myxococcales bacterium]|nr:SDR family oxidoreductase [Myxococcales bacterium]
MSTLLLGANGLVGSRIAARLAQAGEEVHALGRGPSRVEERVSYHPLDLFREPEKLAELIGALRPRGVINAAALTDVDACERAPEEAWALNVGVVEIAARGAARVGARLTSLSTDYVFDGVAGSYSEEDPPNPRGIYARTKRAGEEAALILGKDVAVCRVAVVYTGRKALKPTFAASASEALRAGKPVKAFTDQVVSPTLADNAAEMVLGVHRSGEQGIFHCAGATEVSRIDFCRAIARKLGADPSLIVPVRLADLRLPAPRPLRCGLRVDKVKRLLGEAVPLPLDAALDRFFAERGG